ncbi:hypothetical protein VTI74DRAFT_1078 [Chaetomium olivicolor]
MDHDQFGGRTDDDLFSDDIEPVEETVSIVTEAPAPVQDAPAQPEPAPAPAVQPAAAPPAAPVHVPRSLAQSRHNPNPRSDKPPRSSNNHPKPAKSAPSTTSDTPSTTAATPSSPPPTSSATPTINSKPPPTAPRHSSTPTSSSNTASAISAARLNSGANPRQKLTEEELSARMEKMRLLAAEKTRRFEQAQRDESEHAVAYAKGMEEARKRKAEEAARRKIAEEERRQLEEERAKNRERKLKAMGEKGGWELGRDHNEDERGEGRGFRGAFGGVRGVRASGLGGSRFAATGDGKGGEDLAGFGARGKGGRGRGGRGRGGRGGGRLFEDRDREEYAQPGSRDVEQAPPRTVPEKKAELEKEDFPALPSSGASPKKIDTTWVAKPGAAEIPLSPPVGKWDEEVAAMDEK